MCIVCIKQIAHGTQVTSSLPLFTVASSEPTEKTWVMYIMCWVCYNFWDFLDEGGEKTTNKCSLIKYCRPPVGYEESCIDEPAKLNVKYCNSFF